MKPLLLLLALLPAIFAFSQTSSDQSSSDKSKFNLGLIGGGTLTNMPFKENYFVDDEATNTNTEFGYFVGLSGRQSFNNRFAALLEAQYTVKGFRFATSPLENRWHFHYLDIIPQLEYRAYQRLFASLGCYWGRRIEERFKEGDGDWNTLDNSAFEYAQDNDFGAVAGISFRLKRFSALLRYQHGINLATSGVQYTNSGGNVVNTSQRNRTLTLGIGFNIL
ncbi:MAG: outer membrane beta-barrel protein [Chitinophagales bacterium]|nr:outer membrane beta-barrel protein [Chitinophagales bacterium]